MRHIFILERKMNIDNILTSGFKKAFRDLNVNGILQILKMGLLEYGSDHMPVITEVELTA